MNLQIIVIVEGEKFQDNVIDQVFIRNFLKEINTNIDKRST